MAIEFVCDECESLLKVPDSKAGASGKCPKCQTPIVVPTASGSAPFAEVDPWDTGELVGDERAMPPIPAGDRSARPRGGSGKQLYAYRSQIGLVWAITVLMAGFILTAVACGGACAYQLTLLNKLKAGQDVSVETLENSDTLVQVPACSNVLVLLGLAVIWCVWKAGVNRNARAISGNDLEYTPGWAAGCYFVPFANLVWPYNAMKEIWENSNPSAPTWLVGFWWGLWIFNGVFGQIESKITLAAETIDELINANYVSVIGVPLTVASSVAALVLVWKLHGLQQQAADRH